MTTLQLLTSLTRYVNLVCSTKPPTTLTHVLSKPKRYVLTLSCIGSRASAQRVLRGQAERVKTQDWACVARTSIQPPATHLFPYLLFLPSLCFGSFSRTPRAHPPRWLPTILYLSLSLLFPSMLLFSSVHSPSPTPWCCSTYGLSVHRCPPVHTRNTAANIRRR